MSFVMTSRDGKSIEISGTTGEVLAKAPEVVDLVEVEALIDHQNHQGAFCPGAARGAGGARYFEPRMRAMDLVHRGIVRLVEAKAAPEVESKMAEPDEAEVSEPVVASASSKKGKK